MFRELGRAQLSDFPDSVQFFRDFHWTGPQDRPIITIMINMGNNWVPA
jgi:hypothetical protein